MNATPPVVGLPAGAGTTTSVDESAVAVLGRLSAALDDLPAQRPVAARVIAETDDVRSDSRSLGHTLGFDPVLTAKVLRLANSAYFGLSGRVGAPSFAITVVGFSTVRSLAVAAMAGLEDTPASLQSFWERSLLTAVGAGEIAARLGVKAPDAFSLGMLARLGQALLVRCDPVEYPALVAASSGREDLVEAESRRYGVTHTRVSAEALAAWSFPEDLPHALAQVDRPGWAVPLAVAVRVGLELSERIVDPARTPRPVEHLTAGHVREAELEALRLPVRRAAADMVRLLTS